ncbi:protein translocase subunit SecF [Nocardioides speluncae]|uniref:protein translocase subunit SecF n=1 Tax=Nocardioides speluncae TaxID=2670337 RepID=UPI000D69440C|nr:protein translocase subunit SecF [Nocardioides speluncae]
MSKFTRLGNDLYEGRVSVDFVGKRLVWFALSGVLMLVAVAALAVSGLNFGIEFVGGSEYKVTLPADKATQSLADDLRKDVADTGIEGAKSPVVTTAGESSILVQTEQLTDAENAEVVDTILETTGASQTDLQVSEIGASWGKEVAKRAITGVVVFLILVSLFIAIYFREWKMSVAALIALAHDILITIGVYSLSGFEVTPATVTGVLTILGFSLYDKVVVFDKVRENTRNLRQVRQTYRQAANLAVNQTLVRSINTSLVALLPVAGLLYVGAVQLGTGPLKDLALALFVGIAVGCYSSIFIAPPLLVMLKANEKDVMDAEKRAKARARAKKADPYAAVPSFSEDMPIQDEPGAERDDAPARRAPLVTTTKAPAAARRPETAGSGRVAPSAHGPVQESRSAGRVQPTRKPRSKRGKK